MPANPPKPDELSKWADEIWASMDKTLREIDASILTLSSSALVLSATFIDKLGADSPHLVENSWMALLGAVVLTLVGRLVSALTHALLTPSALRAEPIGDMTVRWFTYLIWVLNVGALVSFVGGLWYLVEFAATNLART